MFDLIFSSPVFFLIQALSLIIAITIHEYAHARAAVYFGDPTPSLEGRVTLNPIKHLDPIGSLMLLFLGFGWGKPVHFDPYNLKNPQRESAIIAFVGPLSNFILAIIFAIAFAYTDIIYIVPFISMNVLLGVLNLLPIHPFDGFKVVGGFLPEKQAIEWYQLERYWIIFLLVLLIPVGGESMITQILRTVGGAITSVLIPGLRVF